MDIQNLLHNNLQQLHEWLPNLAAALLVFILFYIAGQLVKKLILHSGGRLQLNPHIALLLARSSRITLVLLGLITAFGTVGIDISAMVASLGLTGFALGFALKDTISNLLSGVLILLYRPFDVGDNIRVAGHEGKVVSIDLRYTELEAEGQRILIPNSKLFTDPLVVITDPLSSDEP
jgi:small-conductance mechanosensitive channel